MEEALTGRVVRCHHRDGSRYLAFKANNRSHPWKHIVSELIDNANMAAWGDRVANVVIEWGGSKGDWWFSVYDDGMGSDDLQPFFSAGVSLGCEVSRGASTFGMGLFGVECIVDGHLSVFTVRDGMLRYAARTVSKDDENLLDFDPVEATEQQCKRRGMPAPVGTLLNFSRINKTPPTRADVEKLVRDLGKSYGTAIRNGQVAIHIRRKAESFDVSAESILKLDEVYESCIVVCQHEYQVRWGITSSVNRDNGVRLIYGGKLFDITTVPCGEYSIDRFYAEVIIPRSIGHAGMDIFKRGVDEELMSPVYEVLASLFGEVLERAHNLSTQNKFQSLNEAIREILCGKKEKKTGGDDDAGNEDLRDSNGRDPDGVGVPPKDTGRIRQGKKGGKRKRNDGLEVKWAPLGADDKLCQFEVNASRLTFNSDNKQMAELRDSKEKMAPLTLATIASGYMAFALKSQCGYGDYDYQFKKNIRWSNNPS